MFGSRKEKTEQVWSCFASRGRTLFKTERVSQYITRDHPYSTFRENSLKVIELSSISRDALITSLERENSLKQLEPH